MPVGAAASFLPPRSGTPGAGAPWRGPRSELFKLLGDDDRLRLLALCAEEELTVGELVAARAVVVGANGATESKTAIVRRERIDIG